MQNEADLYTSTIWIEYPESHMMSIELPSSLAEEYQETETGSFAGNYSSFQH